MIAASTFEKETGNVFQHFGRTETFRLYTIEGGKVTKKEDVSAAETGGHSALAPFLKEHGVTALIAGGIGGGAREALASCGIEVYDLSEFAGTVGTGICKGSFDMTEQLTFE